MTAESSKGGGQGPHTTTWHGLGWPHHQLVWRPGGAPLVLLVGERSNNSKKFLRVTKINLGDASNKREGVHLHTLEDR